MKKITLILLALLFIFFPLSCKQVEESVVENVDSSIYFSFDISESGRVEQKVSFPLQLDLINLNKKEKAEYIEALCLEIKSKLFFPFFLNFYTTSVVNEMKYKVGEDLIYEEPSYDEKNQTVLFSFIFNDSKVWDFFHPKNEEDGGLEFVKGVFLNKGQTQSNFLFCEKISLDGREQTYGEYLLTILSTIQKKFYSDEVVPPKFSYVYKHFSTKLCTNADKVIYSEGKVVNIWQSEFEALNNGKEIKIYIYSPNRTMWYLTATGGVSLIMLCALVVNKIKNKKRREKN